MNVSRALLFLALLGIAVNARAMRNELVEGNRDSAVRVVIYEDLQCADCLRLRTLLDEKILPRYGAKVAFVHRDLPLARHDWARAAAIAGRWVYEHNPELGIVYRREIMAQQDHISPQTFKPWLLEFAARNNLDQRGILDSLSDARLTAIVEQDYQSATARGVTRVPTVYVGPHSLIETVIYDELARLIDAELNR